MAGGATDQEEIGLVLLAEEVLRELATKIIEDHKAAKQAISQHRCSTKWK
jgi:hypothetical protein